MRRVLLERGVAEEPLGDEHAGEPLASRRRPIAGFGEHLDAVIAESDEADVVAEVLRGQAHDRCDRLVQRERVRERLGGGRERVQPAAGGQLALASARTVDRLGALLADRAEQPEVVLTEVRLRRVGGRERAEDVATEQQRHAHERVVALLAGTDEARVSAIAFGRRRDDDGPALVDRLRHGHLVVQIELVPIRAVVGLVAGEPAQAHMAIVVQDADGRRAGPRRTDALLQHRGDHLVGRRGAAEGGGRAGQHRVSAHLFERMRPRRGLGGEQPRGVDRERGTVRDLLGQLQVRRGVALVRFRADQRDRADRSPPGGERDHHRAMQMQRPHRLQQLRVIDQRAQHLVGDRLGELGGAGADHRGRPGERVGIRRESLSGARAPTRPWRGPGATRPRCAGHRLP